MSGIAGLYFLDNRPLDPNCLPMPASTIGTS